MASNQTQLLSINYADITKLQGRLKKADKQFISDATAEFVELRRIMHLALLAEVPQAEGETARSIKVEVKGKGTKDLELVAKAGNRNRPQVIINTILFGSKPHVILPKKKPFLAFQVGGKWVYAAKVDHPGTEPNDFVGRALDRTQPHMDAIVERLGKLLVNRVTEG